MSTNNRPVASIGVAPASAWISKELLDITPDVVVDHKMPLFVTEHLNSLPETTIWEAEVSTRRARVQRAKAPLLPVTVLPLKVIALALTRISTAGVADGAPVIST